MAELHNWIHIFALQGTSRLFLNHNTQTSESLTLAIISCLIQKIFFVVASDVITDYVLVLACSIISDALYEIYDFIRIFSEQSNY